MNKKKYPYLAYSQLTNCVYIVTSKDDKIDVTKDFENIADWRKVKSLEGVKQCLN